MFEITEFTEARLAVQNRTEKHGDEDVPAVTLSFEITAPNTMLDTIDAGLRHALFRAKPDAEPELPGVEASTPILRSHVIDVVKLTTSHEGWRLEVDDGIDDTKPMLLAGGKLDKVTVEPKNGGSIVLKCKYGTSDVDAERLGKLGMHNGQSVWIKLLKPEPKAEPIDGTKEAFDADHPDAGPGPLFDGDAPAQDATDAFVRAGSDEGLAAGDDHDGPRTSDDLDASEVDRQERRDEAVAASKRRMRKAEGMAP